MGNDQTWDGIRKWFKHEQATGSTRVYGPEEPYSDSMYTHVHAYIDEWEKRGAPLPSNATLTNADSASFEWRTDTILWTVEIDETGHVEHTMFLLGPGPDGKTTSKWCASAVDTSSPLAKAMRGDTKEPPHV